MGGKFFTLFTILSGCTHIFKDKSNTTNTLEEQFKNKFEVESFEEHFENEIVPPINLVKKTPLKTLVEKEPLKNISEKECLVEKVSQKNLTEKVSLLKSFQNSALNNSSNFSLNEIITMLLRLEPNTEGKLTLPQLIQQLAEQKISRSMEIMSDIVNGDGNIEDLRMDDIFTILSVICIASRLVFKWFIYNYLSCFFIMYI